MKNCRTCHFASKGKVVDCFHEIYGRMGRHAMVKHIKNVLAGIVKCDGYKPKDF